MNLGPRLLVGLLWLLHHLPLAWQVPIGRGFGALLHAFGRRRRHIARRNIELCFPALTPRERDALVREHFALMGRSLLERGLLWYAPHERLKRLIHIEGDIGLAERSERPVMWLVPHFVGLEVAGAAMQLFQTRTGIDIYQRQANPYFDRVLKQGRLRFGRGEAYPRSTPIRQWMRRIREGCAFFNMPDQDFGLKDGAFVPFFGVPAATLLAPSKIARSLGMVVQPVIVTLLPGGQGWKVSLLPAWDDWPTEDPLADTRRLNAFIEDRIREQPAQYLWVHRRFKTQPPGEADVYL